MASYLQESALADKLLQKIDEFLIVELPFLQGGSHVLCAIQADGAEGKKVEKLGKWELCVSTAPFQIHHAPTPECITLSQRKVFRLDHVKH